MKTPERLHALALLTICNVSLLNCQVNRIFFLKKVISNRLIKLINLERKQRVNNFATKYDVNCYLTTMGIPFNLVNIYIHIFKYINISKE